MQKKKKILAITIPAVLLAGSLFYFFVLPDFELADLRVDITQNYINEPFELSIDVENTGLLEGEYEVEFFVNGQLSGKDLVIVPGREIKTASIIHKEALAGEYLAEVEGITTAFKVFDEPVLAIYPIENVLHYSALLEAEVTYIGLEEKVDVYFKWRAVGEPAWIGTAKQTLIKEQALNETIKYLKAETAYEFAAVLEWREKETVSQTLTFSTPELLIASFASVVSKPEEYLPEHVKGYGRILHHTPVFNSLAHAEIDNPFTSFSGLGVEWVNVHRNDFVGDQKFYYVSWDWDRPGWVSSSALTFPELSRLKGVDLRRHQNEHLAIVYVSNLTIRAEPGAVVEDAVVGHLNKYDVVSVQKEAMVNGIIWYEIALGQWIHSDYVRDLIPGTRPEGVAAGEKWIEVNLSSQTIYAHQGDKPLYATLISSGRPGFETPEGLFRPWAKMSRLPMSGDRFDLVYKLADVPWVTFFERDYALHGTYWHDELGTVRSAGCVNLSPFDSLWFSRWSDPELIAGTREVRPTAANPGTWFYVHN